MSRLTQDEFSNHRTGSLYGAFAFGSVIVSCYAGLLYQPDISGSEWMILLTFALGAVYAMLGVLGGPYLDGRGPLAHGIYYVTACAVLTAMIFVSPVRGFFGIIVLPLMAQSIFDLRARNAGLVGAYLFAISIGVFVVRFGWLAGRDAAISYFTGFAFTIVFTIITKRALDARAREEKLRRELEAANAQLRELAAQAGEHATTRERNRLAREIHDGLGHYLTVVKTQLDAAAAILPTQPEKAREAIGKAAKLTGDALDDVRRSVGALRTEASRPPLPEALRSLTTEAGLPVTLRLEGAGRPLPPGIEHALFRSAQEGLTNIRKHAGASAAEVLLDYHASGRVTLAITDNGHGANGASGTGFGLQGIRERIEVIGGRVESGNLSTGGFALTIEVPA